MARTRTTSESGDGWVSFTLALPPIPAPRPRVRVHNGVGFAYYAGKYKTFLTEAPTAIPESPLFFDKGTPVHVDVTFYCTKPKKPTNLYPVGDIDNYLKSILDAITKNGTYWHDDVQIVSLKASKVYDEQMEPRTHVIIAEAYDHEPD